LDVRSSERHKIADLHLRPDHLDEESKMIETTESQPPLIGLVRVSTQKQADSGLGLDGQLAALERHRATLGGEFLEIYREVESGKHKDIKSRPRLMEAAEHAVEVDATLVIAKLDRLVRNASVLQYLRDMGVKFVACDNPHANKLTVHILVGVAENEAELISQRTKDALRAYRDGRRVSRRLREKYPDGVPLEIAGAVAGKLGAELPQCRNLTPEARATGQARSLAARRARAQKSAEAIGRLVTAWRQAEPGLSLRALADRLNERRRRTPRGQAWTAAQVKRVLDRIRTA
jgi:DNA invertase Pin-like site-specific DNA recombinase